MSSHLWKVTATKDSVGVKKGMSIEVQKSGTSAKPSIVDLATAFSEKYNVRVRSEHCGGLNFIELSK